MERRVFLSVTTSLFALLDNVPIVVAQEQLAADALVELLRDDQQFDKLIINIWILRAILIIKNNGDMQEGRKDFSAIVQNIIDNRNQTAQLFSNEPDKASLSSEAEHSIIQLAKIIDEFGIRPDSPFGLLLVQSYTAFIQIMALSILDSICSVYPFRILCT